MAKKQKTLWNSSKSAADNARKVLPGLAEDYLRVAKGLTRGNPSSKALHKSRLETKRFRYTLELFRPCYGASLDRRLKALQQLQQCLGDMNDCVIARQLVFGRRVRRCRELTKFSQFLEARVALRKKDLRTQFQRNLQSAGSRRQWIDFLTRPATRRKATRRRVRRKQARRAEPPPGPPSPASTALPAT
jgi:CHAD domain-containing protein